MLPLDFIEELKWRGMLHDVMPGIEEYLQKKPAAGYIGFDPTAESLHVGHLVQIMTLLQFQRCGHTPVVVIGGATAMIGDPSGKSAERNLLSEKEVTHNQHMIERQLRRFLTFEGPNSAILVNNYDWFKGLPFTNFIRDVGKHITINYMMAKDSIQKRLGNGLSFTEFCYQIMQAYDFYHLYSTRHCALQMGGADQWGNIVTGAELIRRKGKGVAFALTTPLLQKSDGSKFGKTESGNVWLDASKTSPYAFYQYWLNITDEEAERLIKIFTTRTQEEVAKLAEAHRVAPHQRILQRALAEDITTRVHSREEYEKAVQASQILFGSAEVGNSAQPSGNNATQALAQLEERALLEVLQGVPQCHIGRTTWLECPSTASLLSELTGGIIFSSKGEARRMAEGGGLSINAERVENVSQKPAFALLQDKYLLVQKGKKNALPHQGSLVPKYTHTFVIAVVSYYFSYISAGKKSSSRAFSAQQSTS